MYTSTSSETKSCLQISVIQYTFEVNLVPKAGLEPAHPLGRGILNPLRLPFRHLGPLLSLVGQSKRPETPQSTLGRIEPEAAGK